MKRRSRQLTLDEARKPPPTHGGWRPRAGRPKTGRTRVPRRTRPEFSSRDPNQITLRVLPRVARLRRSKLYREIRAVLRHSGSKDEFRICHYSIQGNHLHLVCEAADRHALARGVQVFASMLARRINRLDGGRGKVFADRYHSRALRTPTEVRNALCYVLNNWRHHRYDHRDWKFDPFSSGALFDGWSDAPAEEHPLWLDDDEPIPIARPRCWLLREGWRKAGGPISTREVPGA